MNIVVERSSDDDYSSLSSCSSLGENLDEFLNIIYKQKKFRVIDFNPYEIVTTVNQVSLWRLKWKKQTKMWLLLDWVTWIGKICFWTNKYRLCLIAVPCQYRSKSQWKRKFLGVCFTCLITSAWFAFQAWWITGTK